MIFFLNVFLRGILRYQRQSSCKENEGQHKGTTFNYPRVQHPIILLLLQMDRKPPTINKQPRHQYPNTHTWGVDTSGLYKPLPTAAAAVTDTPTLSSSRTSTPPNSPVEDSLSRDVRLNSASGTTAMNPNLSSTASESLTVPATRASFPRVFSRNLVTDNLFCCNFRKRNHTSR